MRLTALVAVGIFVPLLWAAWAEDQVAPDERALRRLNEHRIATCRLSGLEPVYDVHSDRERVVGCAPR